MWALEVQKKDLQCISLGLVQGLSQLLAVLPLPLQHAQQRFIVDPQVHHRLLL